MKAIVTWLGALCVLAAASAPTFAADMYRAPDAGGYKDGPAYVGVNWSWTLCRFKCRGRLEFE